MWLHSSTLQQGNFGPYPHNIAIHLNEGGESTFWASYNLLMSVFCWHQLPSSSTLLPFHCLRVFRLQRDDTELSSLSFLWIHQSHMSSILAAQVLSESTSEQSAKVRDLKPLFFLCSLVSGQTCQVKCTFQTVPCIEQSGCLTEPVILEQWEEQLTDVVIARRPLGMTRSPLPSSLCSVPNGFIVKWRTWKCVSLCAWQCDSSKWWRVKEHAVFKCK